MTTSFSQKFEYTRTARQTMQWEPTDNIIYGQAQVEIRKLNTVPTDDFTLELNRPNAKRFPNPIRRGPFRQILPHSTVVRQPECSGRRRRSRPSRIECCSAMDRGDILL